MGLVRPWRCYCSPLMATVIAAGVAMRSAGVFWAVLVPAPPSTRGKVNPTAPIAHRANTCRSVSKHDGTDQDRHDNARTRPAGAGYEIFAVSSDRFAPGRHIAAT